jgi:tetratricopeptide (TPR) repeat protein
LYKKTGEYEKSFEAFMHYRTAYEISPNQLVNNDMDLLELALLMDNKKNRVFTLLGDTIAKYPDMPEAYINMAEYYCYFVGDKKLMYKFANKAVDMAKSQGDQYVIKKCYRLRTEYAYILGDYKKIKLMKMMYSPSFDPAKAYRDKRYKKMELYRYALQAYFEGDKKSSFKYFKDMQEGSNCINCRYNVCVEALLGKALMLEDEGKYDEALKCLERISEESFDPHLINEFAKKIKEKM